MNTILRLALVALLLVAAVPAYSADAVQMWQCEMDDDASEAEVMAGAQAWIKAARQVKGGERFKAHVYFPVAVNATGEIDVWFVVEAPSFAEWGKFWDNYSGSAAAKQEITNLDHVVCPNSAVWEKVTLD